MVSLRGRQLLSVKPHLLIRVVKVNMGVELVLDMALSQTTLRGRLAGVVHRERAELVVTVVVEKCEGSFAEKKFL